MIVNNPQAKSKTQYGMCYRGKREKREPLLVAQNPSLPFYNGKKQIKIQSNPIQSKNPLSSTSPKLTFALFKPHNKSVVSNFNFSIQPTSLLCLLK